MKKFKLLMSVALLSAVFSACKKAETLETFSGSKDLSAKIVDPSKVVRPYDIDVVYFVPQGSTPLLRYQERMNQLRLRVESFFAKNMLENGFAEKYPFFNAYPTKVPTNGKVRLIYGKYPMSSYVGGEVGLQTAADEVDAYFAANNIKARSEYKLIVIPGVGPNSFTATDAFVPCSSPEKRAFLVDYKQFSAENTVMETNAKFISAFGPYLHELGHAFGLQHHNSVNSVASSGELLMSKPSPAYSASLKLSKADCMILDNNQVFNANPNISYASDSQFRITAMKQTFTNGSKYYFNGAVEELNGSYTSSVGVTSIIAYYDANDLYNWNKNTSTAVAWYTSDEKGKTTGNFTISIPDTYAHRTEYKRLNLCFVFANGTIAKRSYGTIVGDDWSNTQVSPWGARNRGFLSNNVNDVNRSEWTIKSTSKPSNIIENMQGYPQQMFDNSRYTEWIPGKAADGQMAPADLVVDCKKIVTASAFWIAARDNYGGYDAIQFELSGSNDGITYSSIGTYSRNDIRTLYENLDDGPERLTFTFSGSKSFRYLKFAVLKTLEGPRFDTLNIAEIGLSK